MDSYHIWCNLKRGVNDLEFASGLRGYLDDLTTRGLLVQYRITRCKLGLRPPQLREFHVTLDFHDLGQLQRAFDGVAARSDPIEELHHVVNSKVEDVFFALYRDFPDAVRQTGQERF